MGARSTKIRPLRRQKRRRIVQITQLFVVYSQVVLQSLKDTEESFEYLRLRSLGYSENGESFFDENAIVHWGIVVVETTLSFALPRGKPRE